MMNLKDRIGGSVALFVVGMFTALPAFAEDDEATKLAKQTQNPVSSLISVRS